MTQKMYSTKVMGGSAKSRVSDIDKTGQKSLAEFLKKDVVQDQDVTPTWATMPTDIPSERQEEEFP